MFYFNLFYLRFQAFQLIWKKSGFIAALINQKTHDIEKDLLEQVIFPKLKYAQAKNDTTYLNVLKYFTKEQTGTYKLLHLAALRNLYQLAEFLIDQMGYKPDEALLSPDTTSTRPLHKAVTSRALETVEILLAKGADVSKKDTAGNNSLHQAILLPTQDNDTKFKICQLLIQANPDIINMPNAIGESPLYMAFSKNLDLDVIKLLIDKGATSKGHYNLLDKINALIIYSKTIEEIESLHYFKKLIFHTTQNATYTADKPINIITKPTYIDPYTKTAVTGNEDEQFEIQPTGLVSELQ